jgi:hypothetical protein
VKHARPFALLFARGIALVFHPLLLPTYAFLFFSGFAGYPSIRIASVRLTLGFLFFTATFLIPALMVLSLKTLGAISSVHIPKREERTLPFLITAVIYYFVYRYFQKYGLPAEYSLMLLASTAMTLMAMFINLKWKISIHMMGIGGLTGMLHGLSNHFMNQLFIPTVIVIGIAGLLGFSRLYTESHKPAEVYTGYVLGYFLFFLLFSMIPGR